MPAEASQGDLTGETQHELWGPDPELCGKGREQPLEPSRRSQVWGLRERGRVSAPRWDWGDNGWARRLCGDSRTLETSLRACQGAEGSTPRERAGRGTAAVPQAAAPAQDSVKPRMAGREAAAWMGASGVTHVAVLCGRTGGRGRRRRKEAAWEKHASSPAAEAAALPGCPGPGSTLPSSPWSRHGQIRLARPPAFCFDLALISGNRGLTVEPPLRPEPGSDRPCLGQSPALL